MTATTSSSSVDSEQQRLHLSPAPWIPAVEGVPLSVAVSPNKLRLGGLYPDQESYR